MIRENAQCERIDPIRVLQIVGAMNYGGVETMLMNLYRQIDRRKVQFDFLYLRGESGAYDDEIRSLHGRIFTLPDVRKIGPVRHIADLCRFFHSHKEFRIVHCHLCAWCGLILPVAKRCGIPVRIAHSHIAEEPGTSMLAFFRRVFFGTLKPFARSAATAYFACGQDAGDWLFRRTNRHRVTILPNAIDCQRFIYRAETRSVMRNRLEINPDTLAIGHVGRFQPQKNHDFLLSVFAALRQHRNNTVLLLIGDGTLREEIEQKARLLGLSDSIRFLGTRSDICDLLQAMDIFLLPSLNEGLPVAAIEAQAAGLPCVLSDTISRECDVTDSVLFLPLPAGPALWANRIIQLAAAGRIPDAARRVAEKGYDAAESARWLTRFYLGALGPQPNTASPLIDAGD